MMANILNRLKPLSVVAKTMLLSKINKEKSQQFLLENLGGMPGIPAKLSQMLALKLERPMDLHQKIEPLPLELVIEILQHEHPLFSSQIEDISQESWNASLGQVHKVRIPEHKEVAIKVQYPEIEEIVRQQINDLFSLAAFSPMQKKGFDLASYQKHLQKIFLEEVDYLHELEAQSQFVSNFRHFSQIIIPQVYPEFSTKKLLVQDWLPHQTWQEFILNAQLDQRKKIAKALTQFFVYSLFEFHLLHNDLHPGNVGVYNSEKLTVFDFGATLPIEKRHIKILRQMFEKLLNSEEVVFFDYMVALGFNPNQLKYVADRLPTLCHKIFEPFLVDESFNFSSWKVGDLFEKVLGEDKWFFRAAGPTWFFLMMKSVSGYLFMMRELGVTINVCEIYKNCKIHDHFDMQIEKVSAKYQISPFSLQDCARYLKVQVYEDEKLRVDLQMPFRAVDELENLIPESAEEYIKSHKISLPDLIFRVQRSGYKPQTILEIQGAKLIKIFLA